MVPTDFPDLGNGFSETCGWRVNKDGSVEYSSSHYWIGNSYGNSPDINDFNFAICVYSDGIIDYNGRNIKDSYGSISPCTTKYGGAPVELSGISISRFGSIEINTVNTNSYGIKTLRAPITLMVRTTLSRMAASAIGMQIFPTAKLITGGFALRTPLALTTRIT